MKKFTPVIRAIQVLLLSYILFMLFIYPLISERDELRWEVLSLKEANQVFINAIRDKNSTGIVVASTELRGTETVAQMNCYVKEISEAPKMNWTETYPSKD